MRRRRSPVHRCGHAPGGMSGAELALEVRQRQPSLPVLFTSGYAELGVFKDIDVKNDQLLTSRTQQSTSPRVLTRFSAKDGGEA